MLYSCKVAQCTAGSSAKTLTSTDVYKKLKHSCSKHLIDMPSPETRAGKTSLALIHHAFVKFPFRTLGWRPRLWSTFRKCNFVSLCSAWNAGEAWRTGWTCDMPSRKSPNVAHMIRTTHIATPSLDKDSNVKPIMAVQGWQSHFSGLAPSKAICPRCQPRPQLGHWTRRFVRWKKIANRLRRSARRASTPLEVLWADGRCERALEPLKVS